MTCVRVCACTHCPSVRGGGCTSILRFQTTKYIPNTERYERMQSEHKTELRNNVAVEAIEEYSNEKIGEGWMITLYPDAVPILNEGITQVLSEADLAIQEIYSHNAEDLNHMYVFEREDYDEHVQEARERYRKRQEEQNAGS